MKIIEKGSTRIRIRLVRTGEDDLATAIIFLVVGYHRPYNADRGLGAATRKARN